MLHDSMRCKYNLFYVENYDAEKWLSSRWKLSAEQMQQIAWNDLKYVMTTSKATKQQQYTKIIHKMWAVNKRQFKWKQCSSPLCPFCQEVEETRTHLLQCQHPVSKTNRNTALINLRTKLQGISTSPLITNHILRCLTTSSCPTTLYQDQTSSATIK